MNVLIVGKNGFMGFHLETYFKYHLKYNVLNFKRDDWNHLENFIQKADLIVFNSCIIRGDDILQKNIKIIDQFAKKFKETKKPVNTILISSSQREVNNEYGKSKIYAEEIIGNACKDLGANFKILVTPNIFGPFSKPNYNSAVSTFCFNLVNNYKSNVNQAEVKLVYVEDLVKFLCSPDLFEIKDQLIDVSKHIITYKKNIQDVYGILMEIDSAFKNKNFNLNKDDLYNRLYTTYLSFINKDDFEIKHELKEDERGWLFEYNNKQDFSEKDHMFVSATMPRKVRGNHFHFHKFEKFSFLHGKAKLKFLNLKTNEKFEFIVDQNPKTFIIPPFYVHSIESLEQEKECIILFYSNEKFDSGSPDTYFLNI
jgi:UDP-2-acetamido-2,6-beta-L-arabino-hexul-4-ose reductase